MSDQRRPPHFRTVTCDGCGRQLKRLFYTEKGKRCGECIKREGLKKTGAPVYQSRARRLGEACDAIRTALGDDEEIPEDFGDIESLKDEMESWYENMSGTALENTSKFEAVEEAVNTLDSGLSNLEDAVSSYNTAVQALKEATDEADRFEELPDIENKTTLEAEVEDAKSEVENALSELEAVEFPGMY